MLMPARVSRRIPVNKCGLSIPCFSLYDVILCLLSYSYVNVIVDLRLNKVNVLFCSAKYDSLLNRNVYRVLINLNSCMLNLCESQ